MYFYCLYSLLLATTYHVFSVRGERICPPSKCESCLDPSQQTAPGIGFHLGLTYATVAISYSDNEVENLIYIPGAPEYIALMQEFTTLDNRLDWPPLYTYAQGFRFTCSLVQRHVKLVLGMAGTPVAAKLGSMLQSLRSEAEKQLKTSVHAIGIAFPNGALISKEEINDALTYAGLKTIANFKTPDYELNAAYGASGFGICSSYTNFWKCEEEEDRLGDGESVLHIDYTSNTLATNTQSGMSKARSSYTTKRFVDWKLGRDEATYWSEESEYWETVRAKIQHLTVATREPYTQLLLTGDHAKDEKFLEVVKDALKDTSLANIVDTRNAQMDLTFAVARGAAIFQMRRLRGWLDCVQRSYCNETTMWGYTRARVQAYFDPWR